MPSRSCRLLLGIGVLLAISVAPGPRIAAAGPIQPDSAPPPLLNEEERAAARELLDAGLTALGSADYETAIDLFASAFRLTRRSVLLFHIGQAHRLAGRLARAASYYERYLELDPEGHVAPTARVQLSEIQAAVAKQESADQAAAAAAAARKRTTELAQASAASRELEAAQLRRQAEVDLEAGYARRDSGLIILGAGAVGIGISALLEVHGRREPALGLGGVALLLVVGGTVEYLRGSSEVNAAKQLALTPVVDRDFTGAAVTGVLP